ncbi:MAG: NUDIX domain-containing protein [Roseburia sp.]|nr:NUDIX domain-containing protein [Roseburia sp.]MCM1279480.1 NUDIX domain-containing protein [Robinsoniella sp.]
MEDLTVSTQNGILTVRVGAIIRKHNKILMIGNERSDYYYSVGGRVKFGETAEEAVVREVYEETGVRMEVERLGFIHENFFIGDAKTNFGKKIYEISFYFYMKVPKDFEPVCNSFTEDKQKEHLFWIDRNTDKKYYPEFFREELKNVSSEIKHFVTKDI